MSAAPELPKPWPHDYKVGDAVHYRYQGDAFPGTVIGVSRRRVLVELWKPKRKPYLFVRDERYKEQPRLFTLRADGSFRSTGSGIWTLGRGRKLVLAPNS